MSAAMSSTRMRQPSCSPKNVTLLPTTGPRSRSSGPSLPWRLARNLWSALVGYDTSATLVTDTSAVALSAGLRGPRMPKRSVSERVDSAMKPELRADALALLLLILILLRLRLRLLRTWTRTGIGLGLLLLLRLGGAPARALHVDAAAEVRTLGNGDARRRDVPVHRSVVANVDLLRSGDVAGDFAQDDDRLGEHLRFDLAVRAYREDVALQIDAPLDMALDRQIFTAAQLAFDHNRFPDIHHVPPELSTQRLASHRRSTSRRRRRSRRSRRRGCSRFNRLVTLPHR